MKKLIKYYDSIDPKLENLRFTDVYGTWNTIIKALVCDGFNDVLISSFELLPNKQIKFMFAEAGNYNHYLDEVICFKDQKDYEFVIKEINNAFLMCEYYDDYPISSNANFNNYIINSPIGFDFISE